MARNLNDQPANVDGDFPTNYEDGTPVENKVYWRSPVGERDDFNALIEGTIIDGKTVMGPWALMSPASWRAYGVGRLGTGLGQKYEKQPDGKWLKVEG